MTRDIIEFPPFRLDVCDERLWRDDQALSLRPKTFAVLRYLAERPDRLVTRGELFAAIWTGTAVTDDTLSKSIGELRDVLGDDARAPRYIETVPRRGFRWIGSRPAVASREDGAPVAPFVGREAELGALRGALDVALRGRRQVVFITGEAGIGKTTLVEAFLRSLGTPERPVLVARGQCIEHHGPAEPYMPVLDALAQLGAGPSREPLASTLRQHAPAWLARLPSLSATGERPPPERAVATAARMIREAAVALAALTATVPMVLVLEDLHWSDDATTDLLSLLARRGEPARLLVLGTARPVDLVVQAHPLVEVKGELVRQGHAQEILLELLGQRAVAEYLAQRFTPHDFPAALAPLLHTRTEGNPFFVVAALDHLIRHEVLAPVDGRWTLAGDLGPVEAAFPDSVREMIERQLAGLERDEVDVAEAASVVGLDVAAPAVAAALGRDVEDVERRCAELARRGQLLEAAGSERWPDGIMATGFRFRHSLFRTVLYDRVPAARRARMHRSVGERLESGFGSRAGTIASRLAGHFEQGGDLPRAVTYLAKAARRALGRSAPGEAVRGFERAIELNRALPADPERLQERLALTLALGDALHLARGYGSPEGAAAFAEATRLSEELDAVPQQFVALSGLYAFTLTRCRLAEAREHAGRMLDLAARIPLPAFGLMANTLAGMTRYLGGEFPAARELLEHGLTLGAEDPLGTQTDFAVMNESHLACVLALLGHPDQARQADGRARARARETSRYDEAVATFCGAALAAMLRDVSEAAGAAAAAIELTETHGFPMWLPSSRVVHGWAVAVGQRDEAGVDEVRTGLVGLDAVGFERDRTFMLMLFADALATLGRGPEALATVDEALARAEQAGERCCEAELWRMKAGLLGRRRTAAEECLRRALSVARRQQARWWELRATMSLARLWRTQRRTADAAHMLGEIVGTFNEGADTDDLRAARTLLRTTG